MQRRFQATHHCDLLHGSNSCLPKLPPQAGRIKRALREARKLIIVTRNNPKCQHFLRSEASVNIEKARHIRGVNWYIIHPFSRMCMIREIVLAMTWIYVFFKDPFAVAWFPSNRRIKNLRTYYAIESLSDAILIIYSISNFFTGYPVLKTKEIILEPEKISIHYLKTYFIFDVMGNVPLNLLLITFGVKNKTMLMFTHVARLLRIARLGTFLEYLKHITSMVRIKDTTHDIICLVLMTFYTMHWLSCVIYIVPKIRYKIYGRYPSSSWIKKAGITPRSGVARMVKYVESFLTTACHFYMAGTGMYPIDELLEEITLIIVCFVGVMYFCYVVVVVLEIVNSANASEAKYEEIMYQLQEYMVNKKLPVNLRKRLVMYYESRFQKHYFREHAILSTLSEHLRHEIFLHSTKILVQKVELLKGLSKMITGDLVAHLKQDVFLPNDVIFTKGAVADSMYFIVNGTVAVVLPSGREIRHLTDGDHFGDLGVVMVRPPQRLCSIVAVEIAECLRLEKKDLQQLMNRHEDLRVKLQKAASHAYKMLQLALENEAGAALAANLTKRDVIYDLNMGKIVSTGRPRHVLVLKLR